jgi:hypothetical protein
MAVVDVEQGWNLGHADLAIVGIETCVPAANFVNGNVFGDTAGSTAHGTCVLGILVARPGTPDGVTGSARDIAKVAVAGEYTRDAGGSVVKHPEPHNAIIAALSKLEASRPGGGGVLLLETSENWGWYDKTAGASGAPIELREEVHKQIVEAGNLGHTVVEAAGNGGLDLDSLDYTLTTVQPPSPLDPPDLPVDISDPAANDSTAILVGSTHPPIDKNGADWLYMDLAASKGRHRRHAKSCHGKRVDCYCWGDYVQSASGEFAGYTQFGGTSSAAAIVAGVVLLMQGIWKVHGTGGFLKPAQVREILRDATLGTPVWNAAGDTQVGHMPDLFKILTQSAPFKPLGLVPDVYMRDHVGDDGNPHGGPLALSPDIIVRQAAEPHPDVRWAEASGTQDLLDLSEPVLANRDHFVYVRARNRGKAAARNAVAKVYWSEVATLITPGMWHEIGAGGGRGATFDTIARDDQLVVSHVLDWPADASLTKGHYCFVGLIGADGDPAPDPNAFADFAAFKVFIHDVNGATWRNFHVVDAPAGAPGPPLPFWTPGAFDEEREFELRILVAEPAHVTLDLELPLDTFTRFGAPVGAANVSAGSDPGSVRFPVTALESVGAGTFLLGAGVLPKYDARVVGAALPAAMTLHPTLADTAPPQGVEVAVVQLHEGQEVGRVTWRIRP